jgi:hypothetical protein
MEHAGTRQAEPRTSLEVVPASTPLAPSGQRPVPIPLHRVAHPVETCGRVGPCEVLVEAAEFGHEHLPLIPRRRMVMRPELVFDALQQLPPTRGTREAHDRHPAPQIVTQMVAEPEEIDVFPVGLSRAPVGAPERYQPGLLLGQRQLELPETSGQDPVESVCVILALKERQDVVREPNPRRLSAAPRLHDAREPEVQRVVERDIGQHRGQGPALRGPRFRDSERGLLQYARHQPFPDEAEHPRVSDAEVQHPEEPRVVDGVDVTADVGLDDPVRPAAHHRVAQVAERVVRALRPGQNPSETGQKSASSMALSRRATAAWSPRSATVGMPKRRCGSGLPGFGMSTRRPIRPPFVAGDQVVEVRL